MENFLVSARKYRPQNFSTVVGQQHITTTLKNAIRNEQLAHAFLFTGPRGVGKTTCARILAKTINCEAITAEGEACDACSSCQRFNDGTSLNIHELDAASNNSVDDIRSLVDQVRFPPQNGRYKIYIIDEVHMLSTAAFNAFLKTLEEPPSYVIFILATTEKHKILPTILSRCQIFDFRRITLADMVEHLQEIGTKENVTAEDTALQLIAQKSDGCMRDGLSIFDKIVSFTGGELNYANTVEHLNILDADYFFKLGQCMQSQDLAGAMLLYDDINRQGFEGDAVLNGFAEFLRNLLMCKDPRVAPLLEVVQSFRERYAEAAQGWDAATIVSALQILSDAEGAYRQARNKRLHVELAIIKLCYLGQAIDLAAGGGAKKSTGNKSVAFRALLPIALPGVAVKKGTEAPPPAAKLIIETEPVAAAEPTAAYSTEPSATTPQPLPPPPTVAPASKPKIGSLKALQQQAEQARCGEVVPDKPLQIESLNKGWNDYVHVLKEGRNPAWSAFGIAQLQVVDESSFTVTVASGIEEKFLDSERKNACEYLQKALCNATLKFSVVLDASRTASEIVDRPLSSKEQYQKLAEINPLVKELRDALRLELDY